jgi:predicted transcriptional regulator
MMKHPPVKTVQICLDDATKAALSAAAREQDRSASSIVRMALRAYLRKPVNEHVTVAA